MMNSTATILITNCSQIGPYNLFCNMPPMPFHTTVDLAVVFNQNMSGPPFSGLIYEKPSISSISPATLNYFGGTIFSILGRNFGSGCCSPFPPVVTFGNISCSNATRMGDDLISCISPPVISN